MYSPPRNLLNILFSSIPHLLSLFGFLIRSLVGNKNITRSTLQPVLEKLRDHLISKNVAADIAQKLCDSVSEKLEGKVRRTNFLI